MTAPRLSMLQVAKGLIVDAQGAPLRLRGTCVGGWMNMEGFINGYPGAEHSLRRCMAAQLGAAKSAFFFDRLLDYFLGADDIAFIKQCGATAVRLALNYRHFETDDAPFHYLESGFERLDRVVQWCAANGVYVILDMHAVQGWQNPHWHSDNANGISLLWSHKHFQDRYIALWLELAHRYAGNPVIAGYDLMNEPFTALPYGHDGHPPVPDRQALNDLYLRVVQTIRSVDDDHIIFLEGDNLGRGFLGLAELSDGNTVASSHNYTAPALFSGLYPGVFNGETWDKTMQEQAFRKHEGTRYTQSHHMPLWIGEFGAMYNRPPAEAAGHLRALDDQIDVFEAHAAHWTTWTYKDVGVMGWVHLDPDSEYMRLISPVLKAKQELHSDWSTQWFAPSPTRQAADALAQRIAQAIGDPSLDPKETQRAISDTALQLHAGLMMQPAYARLFKDMSESDIDRVLQSFALKNCRAHQPLLTVLKRHMSRPF